MKWGEGLGAPTLWGSPAVLLVTSRLTIGSSQDSFYFCNYSALQNVFFNYNSLPYNS